MINEIEVNGAITFRCWEVEVDDFEDIIEKIKADEEYQFDLDNEESGFHDYEYDKDLNLFHGFYSTIIPFSIDHLQDGITTTSSFQKLETSEFFLLKDKLFTTGKNNATKQLCNNLSMLTGHTVTSYIFETENIKEFQDKMEEVKTIVISNPKTEDIRSIRLSGTIEDYQDQVTLDPHDHEIHGISGILNSSMGLIKVGINKNGRLSIRVKKEEIILVDLLEWLLKLIIGE